jgi:PAS domain S-box-containing protein
MSTHDHSPRISDDNTSRPLENEQRFRALIEHSADAIALLDSEGNFLYVSPSVQSFLGFAPEELVGHNAFELVPP